MIDGLVSGKLHGVPTERTSRDGKHRFVTAKVRCAGGDGESVFVDVTAFSDSAKAALQALGDGDPVAVCGSLSVGVWKPEQGEPRPQVRVTATNILSPYHVTKRRAAVQQARQPQPDRRANGGWRAVPTTGGLEDDELDF